MSHDDPAEQFLRPPNTEEEYPPQYRQPSNYSPLYTFRLPPGEKRHYQQQYADLYFVRLARLKEAAAEQALADWSDAEIAGEKARRVDRVLDVRQGEFCWVIGTVYMDLPLKPNILEDISKEHFTSLPPPRETYHDTSNQGDVQTMLEDESGRLRLTCTALHSPMLVTGAIIAVLGTENANGDFEAIDIRLPDLPPQPVRWQHEPKDSSKRKRGQAETEGGRRKKIALVSGLGISGESGDTVTLTLLADFLLGYGEGIGIAEDDSSPTRSTQISRLIIAGNTLGGEVTAAVALEDAISMTKKGRETKKYKYDASDYNASPITHLDNFLAEVLPSIPVTIMPGATDPANFSLPQQEIHRALFLRSRNYCCLPHPGADEPPEFGWLDTVTNPWQGDIEGWRFWGCSGQNVDDVLRYLNPEEDITKNSRDREGDTRLQVMEAMLRWRCAVPTAPDTLWCYPFQDYDPFILEDCPHVFFIGNQPTFRTAVVETYPSEAMDLEGTENGSRVRLLCLPKFRETGELILLDAETLEVEVIKFETLKAKKMEEEEEE
ncbi:DNA polymerase delta small subunit Cdc1 [Ophidiomyces ophidiicola]|uniref:DNA polymerase delta small subunit Cdc1 n=1 Tax=Ophidiomyces ophidiicola TaxID=1387563 RepID=A0ACB8V054_9EURO|nr:DNA polymerase delta small subunit Cdc1 [Ophidiomyces ophidiicola]KAI1969392.1 DNA polymerase delta small subunit Cdc1 [Ophidiomyces ophidiicola]KAI2010880.1 DNA polymerase delta small subunit Cdc1 [Ophidiomyces ophidiicola]KAI2033645.1 DNA polymerase delta small subunit Cdc1 [Ophidiomyces ophidiicola]KAI2041196.1 DNA polymerase delta small subunit Cdc1 [Ophidiomyces ophidiicola]